jgi:triosephosphate isomerase
VLTIGVSLKMYLGHASTITWAEAVADVARTHPALTESVAEVFVAPTFPALVPVRDVLAGSGVLLAAQDLATADEGAFTGEVSGRELAEIGVDLVEVGHAERRTLFHEDDATVAAKVSAAYRNRLRPLVCVGEPSRASVPDTIATVTAQLDRALGPAVGEGLGGALVVAYEPVWAIGAAQPAPDAHVAAVLAGIDAALATRPALAGSTAIYGGSAGPGLLTRGGGRIDGLFLGRSAHDPESVRRVLDEALALHR